MCVFACEGERWVQSRRRTNKGGLASEEVFEGLKEGGVGKSGTRTKVVRDFLFVSRVLLPKANQRHERL